MRKQENFSDLRSDSMKILIWKRKRRRIDPASHRVDDITIEMIPRKIKFVCKWKIETKIKVDRIADGNDLFLYSSIRFEGDSGIDRETGKAKSYKTVHLGIKYIQSTSSPFLLKISSEVVWSDIVQIILETSVVLE